MPKSFNEHDKEVSQKAVFSCAMCICVLKKHQKAKSTFSVSLSLPASLLVPQRSKLVYQRVVHCIQLMTHKVESEWSQHPVELADYMTIRDYFKLQIVSAAAGDGFYWRMLTFRGDGKIYELTFILISWSIERSFGSCSKSTLHWNCE